MEAGVIVDIISLVVTSGIGIWIGVTVQKKFTNNRALKEYYIEEIKVINTDTSAFLAKLFNGQVSSKYTQEWFKVMTIKIESLQDSITSQLKNVLPEILSNHINLKQFVTRTSEFNNQYSDSSFQLTANSKNQILVMHKNFKNALVKAIVEINRASVKN